MAVYKLLICPECKKQSRAPKVERTGSWCPNCKAYHRGKAKRCPDCGRTMLEAGPPCPNHPDQLRYYSAKWYVKAAGEGPRAVSEKYTEAIAEEAALIKNHAEGRSHLNKVTKTKWADARVAFEKWAENNVKTGTLTRMFRPSLNRLEIRLGHLTLDRISPDMIEEHKKHYIDKGNAASTINHDITVIKRLFKKCVEWGLVENNRVESIERLTEADRREYYLTDDEIERLLERCKRRAGCVCESLEKCHCKKRPRPHAYIITLIALHTGLRKGDILTLKRSEVDFKKGIIRKQLQKKTKDKAITIPLTKTLQAELKKYMAQPGPVSMRGWLFPSPKDPSKHLHPNGNVGFTGAVKEAGLQGLHFHDLRHTFATKFLRVVGVECGRDAALLILKNLLGHTDIKTTQIYAHVLDEQIRDAMRDFGDSF
jgi:integrase